MNIKLNHDYHTTEFTKSTSTKHQPSSVKTSLKSSSKHQANKEPSKNVQTIKPSKRSQTNINQTRSHYSIKRQNTQDMGQSRIKNKKALQTPEISKQNGYKESNKKKRLLQSKKLNSDQQSTNAYRYNKQSADQQQDPYKITPNNHFLKEKSMQPSRDFSINLMCNKQQKAKLNSHKMTQKSITSKNMSPSIHDLKEQITKKIQSFKSLSKLHEQQSQYFTKKVGISNEQQKRLQKMQLIEINNAKNEIFHLRDQINTQFTKTK